MSYEATLIVGDEKHVVSNVNKLGSEGWTLANTHVTAFPDGTARHYAWMQRRDIIGPAPFDADAEAPKPKKSKKH